MFGRTSSPRKYEIKCQWQSWTCSLQGESVLICSARPLCLSHCHCQLFNVADWSDPLSCCKLHCLLPILYSPITLWVLIPFRSCSHLQWVTIFDHHLTFTHTCFLPEALHPFGPVILFMTHSLTFWTSFLPVFPHLLPIPALKNDLKYFKRYF